MRFREVGHEDRRCVARRYFGEPLLELGAVYPAVGVEPFAIRSGPIQERTVVELPRSGSFGAGVDAPAMP